MLLFSRSCLPCKRRHEFRGNLTGTKWAQAPYNNVGPYFEAAPHKGHLLHSSKVLHPLYV